MLGKEKVSAGRAESPAGARPRCTKRAAEQAEHDLVRGIVDGPRADSQAAIVDLLMASLTALPADMPLEQNAKTVPCGLLDGAEQPPHHDGRQTEGQLWASRTGGCAASAPGSVSICCLPPGGSPALTRRAPLCGISLHASPRFADGQDFLPKFLPRPPRKKAPPTLVPLQGRASSGMSVRVADHPSKLVMWVRFPSSAP